MKTRPILLIDGPHDGKRIEVPIDLREVHIPYISIPQVITQDEEIGMRNFEICVYGPTGPYYDYASSWTLLRMEQQ